MRAYRIEVIAKTLSLLLLLPAPVWAQEVFVGKDADGTYTFTNSPQGQTGLRVFDDLNDGRPLVFATIDPRLARPASTKWDGAILLASSNHKLEPELLKALVMVESGFNPDAVSPVGAQGLCQLMPATARALGVNDPFDPQQNLNGGARYLARLLARFDDTALALAAYNAGPSRVAQTGKIPEIPETQYFVQRVLRLYRNFRTNQPVRVP